MESKLKLYRASLMTSAATGLALFMVGAVQAQESANTGDSNVDTFEEITVTGIRASIASSVERKRVSTSIVEAITAEDIGKLPDASIAESIARLPGLAAQRLDGRANVISIRGLAPDFTTTTLNGREQVSANNNRAVEYDQYPSELINGVTIYKTPDASLTSQAVGGTVDLQTISPLAHGQRTVVMNLRGEYNSLGSLNAGTTATGYRGTVSYVDQFADDTIGVAIGYARLFSPTQEERYNAWGYPNVGCRTSDDDGCVTFVQDANGNDVDPSTFVIGGAKPYVKSNELTRDGVLGVLEFAPHDSAFRTRIDAYYSKFNDKQTLRGIEIPLAWSGAQLQDGVSVEDGFITDGQFNGTEVVVRNDYVDREAETIALGWNTEYQASENLTFELDLSYSSVDRVESNVETYSGTGRGSGVGATDNTGFSIQPDGNAIFTHNLDYSDPTLIQLGGPLSWGGGLRSAGVFDSDNGQDGFINAPETDDELYAVRLSAEQTITDSFITSIEYGARYSRREKSLQDNGYFLTLKQFANHPDTFNTLPVRDRFLLDPTSLEFIGMGNMLSYDARALVESGAYVLTSEALSTLGRSTNSWTVTEKVSNFYVQANIDTELGSMPVGGNVGVQAVYSDQQSQGYAGRVENGVVVRQEVTDGATYWDFLPSLNLSFNTSENTKIRVGVAQVLARARMDQMRAGFSIGFDNTAGIITGEGGNPQLKPFKTWQYDLAFETYFGKGGYASAAGFYKEIGSYPFNSITLVDASDIIDISGIDPDLIQSNLARITAPVNINGGKIYGLELSTSIPFDLFSEALTGFGVLGSASFTKSSIKETPDSDPITVPGLSKTVLNGTIYYENYGFQARASVRHRSKFLGEVSALSLTRALVDVEPETIVDAQVSYDLSEIGIEGLSVLFQVNNLTNEPFKSYYNGDERQTRDFQNYGRTFLFGLNYKM